MGLLGLGLRAGALVIGTSGVREGLRRGDFVLIIVACIISAAAVWIAAPRKVRRGSGAA